MTLPSSGAISSQQIDKTLFRANNTQFSLNDSTVRTLVGKPSGNISFSDFYGITNTYTVNYTTTGTYDYLVPPQVANLTIVYPTIYGNSVVQYTGNITPGQTIPITIGTAGNVSTFGTLTCPQLDTQVFSISGNAQVFYAEYVFTVMANTATSFVSNGVTPDTVSGALPTGLNFFAYQQFTAPSNVQELVANVTMSPISTAAIALTGNSTCQVYVSSLNGNIGQTFSFINSVINVTNTPIIFLGNTGAETFTASSSQLNTITGNVTLPPNALAIQNAYKNTTVFGEKASSEMFGVYGYQRVSGLTITSPSNFNYPTQYYYTVNLRNVVPITVIATA